MAQSNPVSNDLVISYLTLRRAIGAMGITLPLVVTMIPPLVWTFCPQAEFPSMKASISEYYDSPSRNVFVGVLFALGSFLGSYRGHADGQLKLFGRDVLGDNGLANISAGCAFATALFPVTSDHAWVRFVHVAAAGGLFSAFAVLSAFQFTRGNSPHNRLYRLCGGLVAFLLVCVIVYKLAPGAQRVLPGMVFYLEAAMLITFGVAWVVKGRVLGNESSAK
jgi:hypothetical protein